MVSAQRGYRPESTNADVSRIRKESEMVNRKNHKYLRDPVRWILLVMNENGRFIVA